jgi:hypothetical protein
MSKQETFIRTFTFAVPTALLAALGAAFGAYLQQNYAVQLEKEKTLLTIRKEAYTDFFKGQVAKDKDTATYETLVQQGRFGIGVYSSKPIVEALAKYFEYLHENEPIEARCKDSREKWNLDVKIYQEMRRELYEDESLTIYQRAWRWLFPEEPRQKVDDKTMWRVIYNCPVPGQ